MIETLEIIMLIIAFLGFPFVIGLYCGVKLQQREINKRIGR